MSYLLSPVYDTVPQKIGEFNGYIGYINSDSMDIPIAQLLKGMDKDGNRKLTAEEIYQGILENCSDTISTYSGIKNMFGSGVKQDESKMSKIEKLEANAKNLGINTEALKESIKKQIGAKGLNLNDLLGTLSGFLGCDVGTIVKNVKRFTGIDLDIKNLTLNELSQLTEDLEAIMTAKEFPNLSNYSVAAYNNYKKGNNKQAIACLAKACKELISLNSHNETSAAYTEKVVAHVANKAGNVVAKRTSMPFLGKVASACVRKVGNDVTGVTWHKYKQGVKKLVSWIF